MAPSGDVNDEPSLYQSIKAEDNFLSVVFYGYTGEYSSKKVKLSVSLGQLRRDSELGETVFEAIETSSVVPLPKPPSRCEGIDEFYRIEFQNSQKLFSGEDYVLAINPHGKWWDQAFIGHALVDAYPHGGEGLRGDP